MITKLNIELALTRNYDKVVLGFVDEPVEHEGDEDLKAGVRKRFKVLRDLILYTEIAKLFIMISFQGYKKPEK